MKKSTKVFLGITTGVVAISGVAAGVIAINNSNKTVENQTQTIPSTDKDFPSYNTPGTLESLDKDFPCYNPIVKPENPTVKPETKPEQSKPVEKPNDTTSDEELQASAFSFSTFQAKPIEVESNKPTSNRVAPTRITKQFESGWVKSSANSEKDVYQTDGYYNQRDFMPILSDSWKMRNYANERDTGAVLNNRYNGWDKTETYFDSKGNPLTLGQYLNHAFTYITYNATDALKEFVKSQKQELQQEMIRMVMIDCNLFKDDTNAEKINKYLQIAALSEIKFVTIKAATQQQLENIKIPDGIKKLTILDHESWNFNKSKLESLRGITIPDSVVELEFYSSTAKKVDPLILPKSTHMIYDHITDLRNYYVDQANFETIDLSKHENMTDDELQQALDTVYFERQYERAFHGYFLGGYISNLDISNTGITSLNNVVIPSQEDGRFNIAYVKWTSNTSTGSTSVVITDTDQPSNDSMVGEWYEPNTETSNVTKLVAKTVRSVSVNVAAKEILAQLKKFPKINTVDIKNVILINGTHEGLITEINKGLTDREGNLTREITFIK